MTLDLDVLLGIVRGSRLRDFTDSECQHFFPNEDRPTPAELRGRVRLAETAAVKPVARAGASPLGGAQYRACFVTGVGRTTGDPPPDRYPCLAPSLYPAAEEGSGEVAKMARNLDTGRGASDTPCTEQTGCFVGTTSVIHFAATGYAPRP